MLTDKLKAALPTLKQDFTKVETYVKTAVVAAVTGGVGVVGQLLTSLGHEADWFSPAGIVKLKHTFLYGAALSVIGLFTKSPLNQQDSQK